MSVPPGVGSPLQLQAVGLVRGAARVAGFAGVAFAVALVCALCYRWYFRERIPRGLAALFGVAVVSLYLTSATLFSDVIGGGGDRFFSLSAVLVNVVSIATAWLATLVGRRVGDLVAADVFAVSGVRELDAELSRFVRTVGRVTAVEVPAVGDIEDMEGYDPVADEVKERLAGKTLVFPRKLTVAELRDRLVTRLKDDYAVGHVDLELSEDGSLTYLALGQRAAGIGPTLAPGTCAVAVDADPAKAASPGDVVQVWRTDPERERVLTAEFRAAAGDAVTLVVDEADAPKLSAGESYRLQTLPAEPQADREFVSLLRAADETMAVVTVEADSDLVGGTVGDLDVTLVGVRTDDGTEALPRRSRTLAAGDTLYAVARPEVLRSLEARAGGGSDDDDAEGGRTDTDGGETDTETAGSRSAGDGG